MKSLWQATIEEMFESGMSAQEIKDSLRETYPEIPELMAYVDDVMFKIAGVQHFCKFGGLEEKIPVLSKKYNITPEEVRSFANYDPTNNKAYLEWIIRHKQELRDAQHTIDTLKVFEKAKKGRLEKKDINQYKSFKDLEDTLAQLSEEDVESKRGKAKQSQESGQEVVYNKPPYRVTKVTTPEAGAHLFRNTSWCVKDPAHFKEYDPPFYMIEKDGKPYALFHDESSQLKDVSDHEIQGEQRAELLEVLAQAPEVLNTSIQVSVFNAIKTNQRDPNLEKRLLKDLASVERREVDHTTNTLIDYTQQVIKGRWPEAEEIIKKDPGRACKYAQKVIKGRWPEAEKAIIQDPFQAALYANSVIEGRWPEAEEVIMQTPHVAFLYARDVIKGRWPEAEETIMQDPEWLMIYAEQIIKGRWPEAEKIIKKHPERAYEYAKNIIKGRWPEGEEEIKKDAAIAVFYAKNIIKGRWPEGEAAMKRHPGVYEMYEKMLLNPNLELQEASSIKRFTKRAQGFGFGYNNPGQTNFSVPNSEGAPGTDTGKLNSSNPSTPTSSYTDRAMMRDKQRKEEKDQQKRRELRKKLVNKMVPDKKAAAPAKPGEALVIGPAGTKPGETIEKLTKNIDDKVKTIDRSLRTTEKEHEMAGQWSSKEQTSQEQGMGAKSPTTTIPKTTTPTTTPTTPTAPKDTTEKIKNDTKKMVDDGIKQTKTLSDATKKTENDIKELSQSVKNLLG